MPHEYPFIQFYPADFLQDVMVLDNNSTGAWIKILCQMWIAPTPGVIEWNMRVFKTFLRLDYDEHLDQMVADLSRVGEIELRDSDDNVAQYAHDAAWIKITNRRIVRDWDKLTNRKERNKRYYDTHKTPLRRNQDQTKTDISHNSEIISHNSEEDKDMRKMRAASPSGFAEFWFLYPKKKSKGQAEKAWNRVHPDESLRAVIQQAIQNARKGAAWLKNNGEFIPYPATWLNAKGWEDEEAAANGGPPRRTGALQEMKDTHTERIDPERAKALLRELTDKARK